MSFLDRLKNEPAVIIGILASAVIATVASLQGNGVLDPDLGETLTNALNPDGGWLLPIIIGLITRFFVFGPKTAQVLLETTPPTE